MGGGLAKFAEVLFLQGDTINSAFDRQEAMEADRRKKTVLSNRNVMKRIVDATIFLGKQGLSFRGHRESLTNAFGKNGNFLELLKLMSEYDATTKDHLSKVTAMHKKVPEQRGGKQGAKGRGSKLTFLSKDSQNKLIRIIGEEITSEVVEKVKTCRSWALIADTTPDVTHKEQLSICVRVVSEAGECSEHLLSCQRATGTKANELYNAIMTTFELQGVTFEKLVAQTYDGASNMSGCYNGLQALVKQNVGNHVAYVHCYAHALNLVLSEAAGVAINVISLFGDLEKLYNLFSKSHRVHSLFENTQTDESLKVFSVKRLNTVRWSAREFCLSTFFRRFDCIVTVLEKVAADPSFEEKQRSTAEGLLASFQSRQITATACLFREIFAITGPLSRYLQSINVDFGNALQMVHSAVFQLQEMRKIPDTIIEQAKTEFEGAEWRATRIRRRRMMDGELQHDQPADTAENQWKRETFYCVLDAILSSLKDRFERIDHF